MKINPLKIKEKIELYVMEDGNVVVEEYEAFKLRYGENWDQEAVMLIPNDYVFFEKLYGKELSYNNVYDFFEASFLIHDFIQSKKWLKKYGEDRDIAVGVLKHGSPCGFALGESVGEAYKKAVKTDSVSAFGGIVVSNEPIDDSWMEVRQKLKEEGKYPFIEVLVAPEFDGNVLSKLKNETKNMRILEIDLDLLDKALKESYQVKSFGNIQLIQDYDYKLWNDDLLKNGKLWEVPTKKEPSERESADAIVGWVLCKRGYSNSVAYVRDGQLIGFCGGQPSRVDAAKFADERSRNRNHSPNESTAATDSFFPKVDGIEAIHFAGAIACINPGGSKNDELIIERANDLDVALMFTRKRVFKH